MDGLGLISSVSASSLLLSPFSQCKPTSSPIGKKFSLLSSQSMEQADGFTKSGGEP